MAPRLLSTISIHSAGVSRCFSLRSPASALALVHGLWIAITAAPPALASVAGRIVALTFGRMEPKSGPSILGCSFKPPCGDAPAPRTC